MRVIALDRFGPGKVVVEQVRQGLQRRFSLRQAFLGRA
jgi:hypothetical protein